MANYGIQDIKELREATGAGMSDVKKALDEADGNRDKALEIIRVKGLAKAEKRGDKDTAEGLISYTIVKGGKGQIGYLAELKCETDFVAKTDKYIKLGNDIVEAIAKADETDTKKALSLKIGSESIEEAIKLLSGTVGEKIELASITKVDAPGVSVYAHSTAIGTPPVIGVLVGLSAEAPEAGKAIAQHIAAFSPEYLDSDSVTPADIEREKSVAKEKALADGKPENIVDKIVDGFLKSFFKDVVLLDQALATDPSITVGKYADKNGVEILEFKRVRVGGEA
ncbi:MAG: translation elongation factor Ts [Bifidobacteriaceae bacterium]|jgi:elongation factor Ts|nr:translation elongation factor Ts [Bifidobacteriaceae bacterium]